MSKNRPRTIWDKIWKDKNDEVVIMQAPNAWLWVWIALLVVSLFLNKGKLLDLVHWAGTGSLSVWAVLELLKGVNYFRKMLGLAVLVSIIFGLVGH